MTACSVATKKFPEGRTGLPAGYHAHRAASEPACGPCVAAHSAVSVRRHRQLPPDELARHRALNAAAQKRLPNEQKLANKHKFQQASRDVIRAAKDRPCADCGVGYPYYVMQFDHLDAAQKEFNIGQMGPTAGRQRVLDEINKCDVVCANCHAERTHQRKQEVARDVG